MKLVLSLDGGGVRESFVMELLMNIEKDTGKRIYDLFDMVVGVSAGAMAASLIATHKSLSDSLVGTDKIFRNGGASDNNTGGIKGLVGTMYTGIAKTREILKMFGALRMSDLKMPTALLTVRMTNGEAVVFTDQDLDADDVSLASVIDASSAAPVFFPATQIKGEYYLDGGIASNDPVFIGIEYAKEKWPDEDIAVLSIGTGLASKINVDIANPQDYGLVRWLSEGLMTIIMDSRRNYNEPMIRMVLGGEDRYLRLTSTVVTATDDVTDEATRQLVEDARETWSDNRDTVLSWIHDMKQQR